MVISYGVIAPKKKFIQCILHVPWCPNPTPCLPVRLSLTHSMTFLPHPGLPKQPEGERSAH